MPETPQQPDYDAMAIEAYRALCRRRNIGIESPYTNADRYCMELIAKVLSDVAAAATARERERWVERALDSIEQQARLRSLGEQP